MTDSRTSNDPAMIDAVREPAADRGDPGVAPPKREAPGDPDAVVADVDEAPAAEEEAARLGDFA